MMTVSDVWFPVASSFVIVTIFVGVQLKVWNSAHVLFGASHTFAQIVIAISLAATVCLAFFDLTSKLNLTFMEGLPFFLCFSFVLFSPLFLPALLLVELILVSELMFMTDASAITRRWHMGALTCCIAWVAAGIAVYKNGPH